MHFQTGQVQFIRTKYICKNVHLFSPLPVWVVAMFMTFVDLLASCDHRLKLKTVHVLSALAFDIRSITGCSCLFFRPRVTIRVQVSFLRPGQGGAYIFINLNTIYFWWVSCISDISKTRPYPGTQSHFRYRICPILLFLFFTSYLNWIYFLSHLFILFFFYFQQKFSTLSYLPVEEWWDVVHNVDNFYLFVNVSTKLFWLTISPPKCVTCVSTRHGRYPVHIIC